MPAKKRNYRFFLRLFLPVVLLLSIYFLGAVGFMLIEDLSFLDALYMSTITITTVGFGLLKPLTRQGTIFIIFLIILGTGTAAYIIINTADYILQELLLGQFGKRRLNKMIKDLKNHYIVCGLGRVGLEIALELERNNKQFVTIDELTSSSEVSRGKDWLYIEGDATTDENLKSAGIEKAKSLFAALDTDSENVYITLSAKALNPSIYIVARAKNFESISKLELAGADRVISPSILGGRRMAALALHPNVCDFIDMVVREKDLNYRLVEIEIMKGSRINNMQLKDISKLLNTEFLIVAILEKESNTLLKRPRGEHLITEGQKIIVMGTDKEIDIITEAAS